MRILSRNAFMRPKFLRAGVSVLALVVATGAARAQSTDIGTIDIESATPAAAPAGGTPSAGALPISSPAAVGSRAPAGSAPALAPAQNSLNAFQPGSVISDKVLRDIVLPSSDYNESAKFTPGFVSSNPNGALGDSKSGWRGFKDGQFNVTFDGIPFGDANDPTHHSAAYFPGAFLGSVIIDRGPGAASQAGYATFGGTMGLRSFDLSDKFGGNVQASYGNFNTFTTSATVQSGLVFGDTRAMLQYSHANTDGQIQFGSVKTDQFLGKLEKQAGEVKVTLLTTFGLEKYNNVNSITWSQWQTYGKNYGQVNNNPNTQQFQGFNNSVKATDMEYIALEADLLGFHIDNKAYTYSYWYPEIQNNGNDQTIEGVASLGNGGTVNSVTITNPPATCPVAGVKCSTTVKFNGVNAGDVTGYWKFNNLRAWGDILNLSHDINAGFASGTLRAGFWGEHVDNGRYQQYFDYTQGLLYPALNPTITSTGGVSAQQQAIDLAASSYKLNLNSHITNYQPYIEYEWRPVEGLSITPGYKYEIFTRDHNASVNQTTLMPVNFTKTYTASLPFLAARYKVTPEISVYAQASKGFLAPTVSAYYVFDLNNASIAPQSTTNYQVGAVYKSNAITASIAAYQITATNFPVTTKLPSGDILWQNGGTARYQGLEADATFAFGSMFGGFANGLAAYASGALMEAKFIDGANNGLWVGGAPRYTAAGGLVYDNGMFFGSLLHKVTGEQYGSGGQQLTTLANNGALNQVAAYSSTDFVAGIRSDFLKKAGFGQKAEFKVGVSNIFDNRAITDISGTIAGLTPAAATGLSYTFQSGRVIYGGLKVDF